MKAFLTYLIPRPFKILIKRLLVRLIEVFFRARQSYPVWFYALNRKPRKLFRQNPPRLNEVQKRVVRDLKETGIAVTHLDELFPGENLLLLLVSHSQKLRDKAKVQSGKTFLRYLWDRSPALDFKNPFVKLSLNEKLLDAVNSYLEMYSRLFQLTLNITRVIGEGVPPFLSQRWHRDPEDKRMLKLFIYLTDVDEVAGPFSYIPYSKYGLKWGKVFPQRPPVGFYPPDGAVEKLFSKEAIKICTGRAGTTIFCDTTGLHKGGYAVQKERVMFTVGYRTPVSAWRTDFKHPPNLEEEMRDANLGKNARFAVQFNSNRISTALLYWFKGHI